MATALPSNSKPARAALPARGAAMLAGRTLVPVIIGRNRFCPLIAANARNRQNMQHDRRQERIPEDRVRGCDRIGGPSRHNLGERPLVGHVVGDVESGQCLSEKQGEQEQHHPAASRIVPDLAVGLSPKRAFQMLKGFSRGGEKAGKARCLAAEEAPQ